MIRKTGFKTLLLAASIGLAVTGCSDTGSQRALSKDQVQFLNHLDQAKFYQKQGQLKASFQEAQNALSLNPDSLEVQLLIAENMLLAGDLRNAERYYRNLLEAMQEQANDSPQQHNQTLLGLARSLMMQRKTAEARAELDQLNSPSQEQQTEALMLQGEIALAENDREKAKQNFQRAREVAPDNVKAIVSLSRLAAAEKDTQTVEALMLEAEQINPNDPELWLWKANYAEAQKDYGTAEEAYIKALEDIGRYDLMTYRKYQTIARLAGVLRAQGKISEAFVYEEILAKSAPGTIKAGYETALMLYNEGKLNEAADELEKVLAQAPGHKDSGLLLGVIRYTQGDLAAADELLSRYSAEGASPAIHKILAATKIKLQNPEEAIALLEQLDERDQDPELLSLIGVASLASGETEEGLEKIERALAIHPENIELRLRLARYHLATQQFDKAIDQINQALSHNKDHEEAKLLLASAYVHQGDHEKAETYLKNWLKSSPGHAAPLNALGAIALQKGNEGAAKDYFQQAAKTASSNLTPLLNLAHLEIRQENWLAAQQWTARALEKDPENAAAVATLLRLTTNLQSRDAAIKLLQDMREANSQAVNIRLALAEIHASQGDMEAVDKLVQEAKEAAPTIRRIDQLHLRFYGAAASKKMADGDLAAARQMITNALKKDANNVELQVLAARLEVLSNQPEKALELIQAAKKQFPSEASPLELEGDLYNSQNKHQEALAAYRAAWELQSSQSLAIKMHHTLRKTGELQASLQPLQDWLKTHPNSYQAMTLLAMAYQSDGAADKAIAQYEKIKAMHPSDAITLNNLAWLYQEVGHQDALSTAQAAYDAASNNAAIADTYGWILLKNNKVKEALAVLEKAHQMAPNTQEIALHLAEAYEKAGQLEKASQLRSQFTN